MENENLEKKLGIDQFPADKEIEVGDAIEKEVEFDFDKHIEDLSQATIVDTTSDDEDFVVKKAKKVDISKLNILDKTPIDREKDLRKTLYGGTVKGFQVVLGQSGYMAKLVPLVHKDTINLLYSNLSRYEYRKTIFRVIYDKIYSISSCSMTFEEWLKATSVEDIETFYYGIYCSTFPDDGTFTYRCPSCGKETTIKVNNNNLFKTTDKEKMKALIREISKNATSKEAMEKYSLVGKTEAFELDDSGIVMEIRTPSLWDSLELLRQVPEEIIDRDTTSVTNMLYIKRFLIPSKNDAGETVAYSEESKSQELLRIIDNLTIDDANQLLEAVSDRVDENRISYSIKNIKCPMCNKEVKETPISIEDLLFTQIFEKVNQ